MQRVVIDTYANNVVCEIDDVLAAFDVPTFLEKTGFDFPETTRVFVEMQRDHYVVERQQGFAVSGKDLPEIQWVLGNLQLLKQVSTEINYQRNNPITWSDIRLSRLFQTDWVTVRHQEQQVLGLPLTFTEQQYREVLEYRQALRALTEEPDQFPTPPAFLQVV